MQDEEIGLNPPNKQAVAHRALCLGALVMRGEFDSIIQNIGNPTVVEIHKDMSAQLKSWLAKEGLSRSQAKSERVLFDKLPGTWNRQEITDACWRTESLGVLLWALSFMDSLPPYDTPFEERYVIRFLSLYKPVGDFVSQAKLRPVEQISAARDLAELWHWRSRTTRIQRDGVMPPDGWTFPRLISIVAEKSHENGDIPQPIENDFPAFGKCYAKLSEEEYSKATSIAFERHFALNWLCGYSEDWDETRTDT